jgi:Stage II sporulation protein E (SpoIIE)
LEPTELARLVADAEVGPRIAELAARASGFEPGLAIVIADVDGSPLLVSGSTASVDPTTGTSAIEGLVGEIGQVRASGDATGSFLEAIAGLVASGIRLAVTTPQRLDAPHPERSPIVDAPDRRLEGELAIGRRIQRSLMPRRFPSLPGWEIAAAYDAAREVGGDLYDAFLLRDRPGCLGIVIADVTGKGIPAALVMADVRALIHAAADHGGGPALTIDRVNRILVAERATGLFVTVAHGVIDAATGSMTLASAGHEPIHVIRSGGRLDVLDPPGCLVGMVADIRVEPLDAVLGPGDALVMHTDGITEARSPDGGFYGDERFEALLATLADRAASDVVDAIAADVARFRAGAEASDDLTLLVVRRTPGGAEDAAERSAVVELGGDADVVVDIASG